MNKITKHQAITAVVATIMVAGVAFAAAACGSAADTVSSNLSKAADNFEIQRHIVFYNGITDQYIAEVDGRCSLGNSDKAGELSVTCKTGPNEYIKDFLGLSDNVTYFVLQAEPAAADDYHYRVNFRPAALIPDIRG